MPDLTNGQIDVVINWMNCWEQLKDTAIPIRFKEDFTKKVKDFEVIEYRAKYMGSNDVAFTLSKFGTYETGLNGKVYQETEERIIAGLGEIKTIRRISDNEVFSIGDEICFDGFGELQNAPIEKFRIDYFSPNEISAYHSAYGLGLNRLRKHIEKPPLGLMPEWIWKERRVKEIDEAIKRYSAAKKAVPISWVAEHQLLKMWLKNRDEDKHIWLSSTSADVECPPMEVIINGVKYSPNLKTGRHDG